MWLPTCGRAEPKRGGSDSPTVIEAVQTTGYETTCEVFGLFCDSRHLKPRALEGSHVTNQARVSSVSCHQARWPDHPAYLDVGCYKGLDPDSPEAAIREPLKAHGDLIRAQHEARELDAVSAWLGKTTLPTRSNWKGQAETELRAVQWRASLFMFRLVPTQLCIWVT